MKAQDNDIPVREIYKSCDYDKFKFLDYNRAVINARKLEKSIKEIDITDCCPIVVTKDFYIIDGQHRFSICKKLGRPIYYVIFSGDAERAMVNLNVNATIWRQQEWFEYYCGKQVPVYLALRDFMEQYPKMGISNAILIFSGGRTGASEFKKGKLAENNPRKDDIVNFLYNCNVRHAFYRPFVTAVQKFMLTHTDKEIKKLQRKVVCIPNYMRTDAYTTAFENLL